jgi:hypothetical protein
VINNLVLYKEALMNNARSVLNVKVIE